MFLNLCSILCSGIVLLTSAIFFQTPESKERPENKGAITGENLYDNPTLGLSVSLPGSWHFFDRTMYSSAETKKRDQEVEDHPRPNCEPFCKSEIDVALQSSEAPFPSYALFLGAHKLSPEFQDRKAYPLKRFAEVMILHSLGDGWVADDELTSIQLGGKPCYRLVAHNRRNTAAKAFAYVGDSNGRVFLLLGTALSGPEKLQAAIEHLKFADVLP